MPPSNLRDCMCGGRGFGLKGSLGNRMWFGLGSIDAFATSLIASTAQVHRQGRDGRPGWPDLVEARRRVMTIGENSLREGSDLQGFLQRIQSGDDSAARELLQRYEPEVRLVVRRQLPRLLRSRFDSLDFLQSVWGSFFRRMRDAPTDFEDSRHLVAFLARAAKNKVIDEYRRAASLKQDMHREEPLWGDGRRPKEVADPIDSPSELAQAHEVLGRLRDLLPEERRSILELKAEGLSSREIGERLGISERTVQRVLEELRRRMESEWESRG